MEKKENTTKINPDDLLDILFKKKMEGGDSLTEVKDCETIKELYDLVSAVYVQFGNAVELTDVLTSLKEKNEVTPEIEQLTLSAIEKIKTYRAGLLEKSHMGQCFDMALYSYLTLVDNMAKAGEEYEWLRAKVSELARETAFLFEALYPGRDAQAIEALTDPYSLEKVMKGEELTSTDPVTLDKDEAYKMFDLCEKLAAEMRKKPDADPADLVEAFIRSEYKSESNELQQRYATLGNRLFDISDRQYQFALSVRPESAASILPVPDDIMSRLKFDEKTGQLSITDENNEALNVMFGKLKSWTSKEKVTASDFMFLRTALTALYKNPEFIDADKVTIKRSELGKHMGADLSAGKAANILAKFKPLEKLIGLTPDGSIYRVFTFLKYEASTDSYSFACPFINRVILNLEEKNQVEYKSKTKGLVSYNAPHINFLLHSTLHKERNERAIEIVMALTNLMLQRAGEYTRKPTGRDRFDAHIKYSTLISYCPLLEASLENCPDKAHKNRILKSAFTKAATLLKEKTDAYTYFENLKISNMSVTNSTLDETIRISFTGIHRAE